MPWTPRLGQAASCTALVLRDSQHTGLVFNPHALAPRTVIFEPPQRPEEVANKIVRVLEADRQADEERAHAVVVLTPPLRERLDAAQRRRAPEKAQLLGQRPCYGLGPALDGEDGPERGHLALGHGVVRVRREPGVQDPLQEPGGLERLGDALC